MASAESLARGHTSKVGNVRLPQSHPVLTSAGTHIHTDMHTHTRAHTAQSRVSPRPSPRTAPRVPGSQAERSTRHGGHVAAGQTWLICSASGKCILGSQLGLSRAQDDSTAPPRRPQADCRGEGRNRRRNGRDRQGQPPSTRAAPAPPPAPFRAFPSSFSFLSI